MRARVLLLLATIFSLAQGPLLPSVFSEGFFVVSLLARLDEDKPSGKWFLVFFAVSFLFDLVQSTPLGVTPVLFLVLILAAAAVKGGFLEKPGFLGTIVFLTDILRAKILFGDFMIWPAAVAGVLAFLFFRLMWRPKFIGVKLQ